MCGTPEYIAREVILDKGYTTAVDWWALGILIYEILKGTIAFPQEPAVSEAAKDIIRQLCTVDSSCRLGNISGGAAKVKAHPFFAGVDWAAVYQKRHCGPIIPPIKYSWDTQCFEDYPEGDTDAEEEYTKEMATEYDQHFEAC